MKCLNCNNEINVNSNFCEFCGSKVEKNKQVNLFCTNCGSKIDGGNFCSKCGTKVSNNEMVNDSNAINNNVSINQEINNNSQQVVNQISNGDKNIILNVIRQKKTMGFAVSFTVHVDDVIIGKLKNGSTISCNIKPGHHVVNIESVEKNTIQEIDVSENMSSVEIIVVAKMGFVAATAKLVDVVYK